MLGIIFYESILLVFPPVVEQLVNTDHQFLSLNLSGFPPNTQLLRSQILRYRTSQRVVQSHTV